MNKRFLSQASFHSAAFVLGMYLADGMSVTVHVAYVTVALFASYMSQRRPAAAPTAVTHLPAFAPVDDEERIMTKAQVEEMLSHAS